MSHIHEKIDFTVDVFVVHENKVLLRMHDKYHLWLAPGGHIELHEDPNGLISVVGGKFTTFRRIAEQVVDRIAGRFPEKKLTPCRTAQTALDS